MNKLNKFLRRTFFKPEYDIQILLLNLILIAASIGASVACIISVILGFSYKSILFIAAAILVAVLCLIIANKFHKTQLATIILCMGANNIFLPAIYFTSGGLESGSLVWYTLSLIFPWILLKGKKCYVVFSLNLICFIATIISSYFRPQAVIQMATRADVVIDSLMAVIITSLVFGSIFKYQAKTYERQRLQILENMSQIQKATQAKTEFLSNMSHDIRTPMNAIIGFTEIAKNNIDDRKKLIDCFSKINISSNHLLHLINEVLDMSVIENGTIQLEEESYSLRSIIAGVSEIMHQQIDEKQLELKIDISEIIDDYICCDKLRLNQILINLLSNAVKFSKPQGTVYLSVIQMTDKDDGQVIYEIRVKDEGCGIAPEFIDKIFLPFERENTLRNSNIQGSGLGLTITQSLVSMMNGTIEVHSEVTKGTEFVVTLPFIIPSLTEIEENEEDISYNFEGYRLLLVDDNALNRELESELLTEAGFMVDEARDGTIAIEKVSQAEPGYYSAILMDIQMPIMNGYEVTRIIRAFENKQLSLIPIIALSANAFTQDKHKAFEYGMNAFLAKPLIIKDLYKVLNIIMNEEKRRNSLE